LRIKEQETRLTLQEHDDDDDDDDDDVFILALREAFFQGSWCVFLQYSVHCIFAFCVKP